MKSQDDVKRAKEDIAWIMRFAKVQGEDQDVFVNKCAGISGLIDHLANEDVSESKDSACP